MKVLFVQKNIHRPNENPFVGLLVDSLKANGIEVDHGLERFWEHADQYDLVHFQWPEKIFGGGNPIDLDRIARHLDAMKQLGIKRVITCHNLRPHKAKPELEQLYDLLYEQCDAIHHMGTYSFDLLRKRYPNAHHFIVEHHAYYDRNDYPLTQAEARRQLHLPPEAQIMLCFGEFRFEAEREMIRQAFERLPLPDKYLLAPGYFRKDTLGYLKHQLQRMISPSARNCLLGKGFLPQEALPLYLIAADLLVIQRKDILNSGNLPLGFTFGKAVVGPDRGNVGAWLRQTANPTFDPEQTDSVAQAIRLAFQQKDALGASNLAYAQTRLDRDAIARQLIQAYHIILQR